MAKLNWTPWMGIGEIKERMDQLMDDALEGVAREARGERTITWRPEADMYETQAAFVFLIELPGIDRKDVVLELKPRELAVHGKRRFEGDVEGGEYKMLERTYGPFARSFVLPEGVDGSGASAVFSAGLLTVTLPKKGDGETRRIDISTE